MHTPTWPTSSYFRRFACLVATVCVLHLSACVRFTTPSPASPPSAATEAPTREETAALVDAWIVPVAGFSESDTAAVLQRLRTDLPWLEIRAADAVARPPEVLFPDEKQVVAQKIIEAFIPVSRRMPQTKSTTAFVYLIPEDLNFAERRLRFLFAACDRNSRVAIVSSARLHFGADEGRAASELQQTRLYKLVKRQIGELRLGLSRVDERDNLMYAPLMGLADLDNIGIEF